VAGHGPGGAGVGALEHEGGLGEALDGGEAGAAEQDAEEVVGAGALDGDDVEVAELAAAVIDGGRAAG
jgi:hypothetical protein